MNARILTPSFILFGCFILGGMIFKAAAPVRCGEISPTDNIFVLTGDVRRIPFAMKKTQEFPDANLYIIGAGSSGYALNARPVTIESKSKSTYQNALAIKDIATKNKLKRLVVITTEDHINRAKYLIKHELPDVNVIACPAILTGMPVGKRLERWTTEYIKYIVTLLGIKES
ncbi:MAG: YdcF family protein [Alphaproteobacteria bacterium]|nr:YdcF family protein [Alphaproteobacteria bacterium]